MTMPPSPAPRPNEPPPSRTVSRALLVSSQLLLGVSAFLSNYLRRR